MLTRTRRHLALVLWLLALAASATALAQALPGGVARIHYLRPDGDYEGFELHVWEDTVEQVTWQDGLDIAGETDVGVFWDVRLAEGAERLGFIVHRGDDKDPGPDMFLTLSEMGNEVWLVSGSATIFSEQPASRAGGGGDLRRAQAHWLRPDLIAWRVGTPTPGTAFALHADLDAGLVLADDGVAGGETVALTLDEAGLPAEVAAQFPHLADYQALRLSPADAGRAGALLRGQLALSMVSGGVLIDATGVQIPGVLDALYANDEALGVSWHGDMPMISVWAPTARTVRLHLFGGAETDAIAMERDDTTGVWFAMGESGWLGREYLFEVTVYAPSTGRIETNRVTDPYALDLTTNSARTRIVDLADPSLMPEGWLATAKPGLTRPEDIVLYELHLRDFSASDTSVPEEHRGTFLAFTHEGSFGMRHLRGLQAAGLTHVHLLPTFDIATIDEDAGNRIEPIITDAPGGSASPRQQDALHPVRDRDAFNWGYDPYHYTVPEGSYATDPEGGARIVEFRRMVQALNASGLRVVVDVVYNHTNAAGQDDRSVLDRIVPGYYHRLDENGFVTTSTCCANTASEHAMMRKLMVDSTLTWATAYRVDGFRFDLMGHHMLADMRTLRAALNGLTATDDGVDGRAIYVYGEGWNFGEVADGARGVNATQLNTAGTGIGSFNDRLRDAVRGGGPFDSGEAIAGNQGFASGLATLPSRVTGRVAPAEHAARNADLIRIGLAGNLRDFTFEGHDGSIVSGAQVDYNGAPGGYTLDPQENIVYVSAHDNRTLWDILQLKLPDGLATLDRVRLQTVALSTVALAQGVPLFHAGSDLLRSKSLDRNSYNSSDHFNRLDFTFQSNNFGVGLPPADDNRDSWNLYRPVLENPLARPTPSDIAYGNALFQELLRVRGSSPLFRLANASEVQARLTFHNTGPEQTPGLIVMSLSDEVPGRADLDERYEQIVVVINAGPERQTFAVDGLVGLDLRLHPVQRGGLDPAIQSSAMYTRSGELSVPAFTTAVFVLHE
jgi:pullulanase-type alpha-1,6-glucosidase